MNNAIQTLYGEHAIILNAVDAAKQLKSQVGKNDKQYEQNARDLINFFRNYADNFHHHKEEQILFPAMQRKNELLGDGVLKEMFDNHEDFRDKVKNIERLLDDKNYVRAQDEMEKYTEALLDHIAVENDEVFQMAESLLTEPELEKIFFDFEDADIELGSGKKQEFEELVESLRGNLYCAD